MVMLYYGAAVRCLDRWAWWVDWG